MTARLVLFLTAAFSLSSFAVIRMQKIDLPSRVSKVNFVPSQEGLRELQMPLNMMAASPRIDIVDRNGNWLDNCSSSSVSDDGTLLTAGHCIDVCLENANAVIKEDGITVIDRAAMAKAECFVKIDGKITKAEILATNDCRGDDWYKSGNSKVQCRGVDYAVLKVDPKVTGERPCHHVAHTAPGAGTEVAGIGFPPQTYRSISKSKARDSDGVGQHLSNGQVIPFSNQCHRDIDPPPKGQQGEQPGPWAFSTPEQAKVLRQRVEAGDLLQTSVDVLKGVSGGGLSDTESFELVGVARSTFRNSVDVECVGSGFYTSTASILDALKADYPQLRLDEVFRCEKNAFAPLPKSRRGESESVRPLPPIPGPKGYSEVIR